MKPGGHSHSAGAGKNALLFVLAITFTFMIVEALAGFWTGSLALLSDAAHMLTDVFALCIAFFAMWFSARPPTVSKTYGFYRMEILAAFVNGALLMAISLGIIVEAYGRIREPEHVKSLPMTIVAAAGLVLNLGSAYILTRQGSGNLNIKGALYHVISDALGSVGAIAAGLIMLFTGWYYADSIISILVSLLIIRGAWVLLRESVHILLEGTPKGLDLDAVKTSICSHPGVESVHDLHAWTLTQGHEALSAHLVVTDIQGSEELIAEIKTLLSGKFSITHVTLQLENEECEDANGPCYGNGDEGKG